MRWLDIVAAVVLVWFVALWTVCLLGCLTARRLHTIRTRPPLASASPNVLPGLSIIRPLKGLDPNIYENLESTLIQDHPNYEIIFAVADMNDPVLRVVDELLTKYPHVKSGVVIGDECVGVNPKVNNLVRAFERASYDLLWVLDSGVQVAPGTLSRSVDLLLHPPPNAKRKLGLIHHVPIVAPSPTYHPLPLGIQLEQVFLNTTHAKMYIALNTLAIDSCVVGKSNIYRKSDIEQLTGSLLPKTPSAGPTGLVNFGKYLAEDNMIAGALWHELDLRHSLSCDPVYNLVGNMTLSSYIQRRIRWIRVRKRMVLLATLIEPFTEFILLTAIATWAAYTLFRVSPWFFVSLNFGCWIYVDLDVYTSLVGEPLPSNRRLRFLAIWCLRELLALPIWLVAFTGNTVEWRNVQYRVSRNGEVEKITPDSLVVDTHV